MPTEMPVTRNPASNMGKLAEQMISSTPAM